MEKRGEEERRQYECLRKYNTIVNQFDQLMDVMDAITQLPKRPKTSNRQARKKSSTGAGAIHSVPTTADEAILNAQVADQGDNTSKISSPTTRAEKTSALEQIITQLLADLQSDQSPESSSQFPQP